MDFKRLLLVVVIFVVLISLNADYTGAYSEFFFGRLPGSRAEALGRGYVTISNDPDTYYFNPAGISNIHTLNVNMTTSGPYYMLDSARYYHLGICHDLNTKFTFGFNINLMSSGEYSAVTDEYGTVMSDDFTPYLLNNTLTVASKLIDELSIGLNMSYFTENYCDDANSTLFFDAGAIYNKSINSNFASENDISLGASIKNLSFSKVDYDHSEEELPVITRLGLGYAFRPNINNNFMRVFYQAEYKTLLNYEYRDGFHTGLELKLYDWVSLRCGYYCENLDQDNDDNNEDQLAEFTYGFGLDIPVYNYLDIPIQLNIDYTNLKQPSYVANYDDWDNFQSITIKIAVKE